MRVPKTGSQSLASLTNKLKLKLHFKNDFREAGANGESYLDVYEQEKAIQRSLSIGQNAVFYGMHESYIEYENYGYGKPIFISLIRNPIEKEISWFYYIRSNLYNITDLHKLQKKIADKGGEMIWRNQTFENCVLNKDKECVYILNNPNKYQGYKRQSLQFCGNYEQCWGFGSNIAIQMAKHNVEKNFAVVGSWEDTEITLKVFEHYIPKYFTGALETFKENIEALTEVNKNNNKPEVKDEIKQLLHKNFTGELNFYYFCKQRLYKQYLAILKPEELDVLDSDE